jgi:hypothetical protein
MLKINIRKNGKIVSKTFNKKVDLLNYVLDYITCGNVLNITNKIWNLGVGSSLKIFNGTIISVRGKSPYHNTEHGKLMYGS